MENVLKEQVRCVAPWPTWLKITVVTVGVLAAYKLLQSLTDEDYGDGEYPRDVREEMIDAHVRRHGYVCHSCGYGVRRRDLTVDHIVAMANDGLTSWWNARVICLWCNSEKGARNSVLDQMRGRAAW